MFRISATIAVAATAQSVDDLFDDDTFAPAPVEQAIEQAFEAPAPAPAPVYTAPKSNFVGRKLAGVDEEDEDWTPAPAPPAGPPVTPAPATPVAVTSTAQHNICTWGYYKGRDIAHHDLYSLGVPEGITSKNAMLAHCRDTCELETKCEGFAWFGPGKKCEFKTALPDTYNTIMLGTGQDPGHDLHIISDLQTCKPATYAASSARGTGASTEL